MQAESSEFSPEDLREWETDQRGKRFWQELRSMAAVRMSGIRQSIFKGEHNQAAILAGELNMAEEILQLIDIIIEEEKEEQEETSDAD